LPYLFVLFPDTVDYKSCVGDSPVWGSLRLAPIIQDHIPKGQ